jgi:hypothetical protein
MGVKIGLDIKGGGNIDGGVFENRVLRILGTKRDEVTGG